MVGSWRHTLDFEVRNVAGYGARRWIILATADLDGIVERLQDPSADRDRSATGTPEPPLA